MGLRHHAVVCALLAIGVLPDDAHTGFVKADEASRYLEDGGVERGGFGGALNDGSDCGGCDNVGPGCQRGEGVDRITVFLTLDTDSQGNCVNSVEWIWVGSRKRREESLLEALEILSPMSKNTNYMPNVGDVMGYDWRLARIILYLYVAASAKIENEKHKKWSKDHGIRDSGFKIEKRGHFGFGYDKVCNI